MKLIKKALLVLALTAAGIGAYAYASRPEPEMMTYVFTVQPGDTIWSICAKAATDVDNMREVMDRAIKDSQIGDPADLQPGQLVIVRVKPVVN